MDLREYFESRQGLGVLATADNEGRVSVAVYARPQVIDEETVAFIMADRLSHSNLTANPQAAYLFREEGRGYAGKRLFLRMRSEETDPEKIESFRRKVRCPEDAYPEDARRFLVFFRIEKVLPLVGTESAVLIT